MPDIPDSSSFLDFCLQSWLWANHSFSERIHVLKLFELPSTIMLLKAKWYGGKVNVVWRWQWSSDQICLPVDLLLGSVVS